MLKSLFGSVSSRRHRQSPMVAAQVSPLERRELLDGTTGYGSYDPYGTSSSGSESGSSTQSGSGSTSQSAQTGSGSGNSSGSTSQSQQGSGSIDVQKADPYSGMISVDDAFRERPDRALLELTSVPFVVSGEYFGNVPGTVVIDFSDGRQEIHLVTSGPYSFGASLAAAGSSVSVTGSLLDPAGTLDTDTESESIVSVSLTPQEVIASASITPGRVKSYFTSKATNWIASGVQVFRDSGQVLGAAEDYVAQNPNGPSVDVVFQQMDTIAVPAMQQLMTSVTTAAIQRSVDEMFGDHGFTMSVKVGANNQALAVIQSGFQRIFGAAATIGNIIGNAQDALEPYVHIQLTSPVALLTSTNLKNVFLGNSQSFGDFVMDTVVIQHVDVSLPLRFDILNPYFPTGSVGLFADGVSLRRAQAVGAGGTILTPELIVPAPLLGVDFIFQYEYSYQLIHSDGANSDSQYHGVRLQGRRQ